MSQKPSVGRIVHLTNGAGGCLAAIITAVNYGGSDGEHESLHMFGLNGGQLGQVGLLPRRGQGKRHMALA